MAENSMSISSFVRWWATGLRDVFSAPLSNLIFGPSVVQTLSLRGDRAILRLDAPGESRQVFDLAIEKHPDTGAPRIARHRDLRRASDVEAGETVVRLDQSSVLTTQIDLPARAALDLRSAVKADLDRFTPFSADNIYFDAQIVAVDDSANRIKVMLQVAQISDVEAAVSIARSAGLRPTRVTGASPQSGAELNLLPPPMRHRPLRLLPRVIKGLVVLLLCAAALHAALLYARKQSVIDDNQARIRDLRATAIAAAEMEDRLAAFRAAVADMETAKSDHPSAMVALAEVTESLLDQSFLLEFEMQGNLLKLSGFTSDPSDMLVRLEGNDRLRNARFTSPLTRDPRSGLERFNVEVELAGDAQ